jgi:diguanylate cyclase (GGDEF)-like protein
MLVGVKEAGALAACAEVLAEATRRLVEARTAEDVNAVVAATAPLLQAAEELSLLEILTDVATLALSNAQFRSQLDTAHDVTEANRRLEEEIEEHWQFAAEVFRQSVTDELTGLYNRRGFFKRAEQELAELRERQRVGMVLFLDLDGLKELNDTEGHDAGDALLVEAAELLRRLFRDQDVLARIGGDEFAVFVPGWADVDKVVERLRTAPGRVRLSIGTAVFDPDEPKGLYELLGLADSAMYDDKRAHKAG